MARAASVGVSFVALVLAGSRGGVDPVAEFAGVSDKALIVLDGATLLARVVAAVRAAGAERVLVSATSDAVAEHARTLGAEVLRAAAGPSLSTAQAFAQARAPLLVTTADHALLRPEWIAAFLADAPAGADVCALLARRDVVERDAPATKRTWLRFADGDWSGCNMFWLATPRAAAAIDLWRAVEADRKRPWRIVRRLGLRPLLAYAAGRLTLAAAVARLGETAGVRAAAVASRYGLAAVDVDKPADLELVRGVIANPRDAVRET